MSDRIPTFADVCSAIAEGHIAASTDGSMYHVNAFELRRYLNKHRPLPSVAFTPSASSDDDPLVHTDASEWSAAVRTSVA